MAEHEGGDINQISGRTQFSRGVNKSKPVKKNKHFNGHNNSWFENKPPDNVNHKDPNRQSNSLHPNLKLPGTRDVPGDAKGNHNSLPIKFAENSNGENSSHQIPQQRVDKSFDSSTIREFINFQSTEEPLEDSSIVAFSSSDSDNSEENVQRTARRHYAEKSSDIRWRDHPEHCKNDESFHWKSPLNNNKSQRSRKNKKVPEEADRTHVPNAQEWRTLEDSEITEEKEKAEDSIDTSSILQQLQRVSIRQRLLDSPKDENLKKAWGKKGISHVAVQIHQISHKIGRLTFNEGNRLLPKRTTNYFCLRTSQVACDSPPNSREEELVSIDTQSQCTDKSNPESSDEGPDRKKRKNSSDCSNDVRWNKKRCNGILRTSECSPNSSNKKVQLSSVKLHSEVTSGNSSSAANPPGVRTTFTNAELLSRLKEILAIPNCENSGPDNGITNTGGLRTSEIKSGDILHKSATEKPVAPELNMDVDI